MNNINYLYEEPFKTLNVIFVCTVLKKNYNED